MNNHIPNDTSMELSFPSELGYEIIARDAVVAFAKRMGFSGERLDDLKTAFCEACINAIEHGNGLRDGLRVTIACRFDQNRLLIEVSDQGVHVFDQEPEPLTIAQKLVGLGSLRGMGLMLIKQLSDESGFLPDVQQGNCFRLAFLRQPASA
jgi:serine/threonine-protein kinase RsbW